jgi:hypothetical protein
MAEVLSLSEADAAAWMAENGRKVVRHLSRCWEQAHPGFYQPVHMLGPLDELQLSRPALACWGYRAVVSPGIPSEGNLVVYLRDNLRDYDMSALTRSRRGTLRRAQRSALRLVHLEGDALLRREGYRVCLSALARTGSAAVPTPEQYARWLTSRNIGGATCGIAALLDGQLVGYITAHVIEGTSYGEDFHVATEALKSNVSTVLVYEMMEYLRQSGVVQRAWNGMVYREDTRLTEFKTSMGFAATAFPTQVHLWPGTGALLRRWKPYRYERLMGDVAA